MPDFLLRGINGAWLKSASVHCSEQFLDYQGLIRDAIKKFVLSNKVIVAGFDLERRFFKLTNTSRKTKGLAEALKRVEELYKTDKAEAILAYKIVEQEYETFYLKRQQEHLKTFLRKPSAIGDYDFDKNLSEAQKANILAISKEMKIERVTPMPLQKADKQKANPKGALEWLYTPEGYKGQRYSGYVDSKTKKDVYKNPFFKQLSKEENDQYGKNCQTCVSAFRLRELGFDIIAGAIKEDNLLDWLSKRRTFRVWRDADGTPARAYTYKDWAKTKRKDFEHLTSDDYKLFFEEKTKNEGLYIATVKWKKKSGHATLLKRVGGKLYRVEPQHYDGRMLRPIEELIEAMSEHQSSTFGVLPLDDKIFDLSYLSIFSK